MDDLTKQLKTHFDEIAPSEAFLQKLQTLEAPKKAPVRRRLLPITPEGDPGDDPLSGDTKEPIHASYSDGIVTLRTASGETAEIDVSAFFNGKTYYGIHTAFGKQVAITLFKLDDSMIVIADYS